jgi:hypothetical protein
MNNQNPQGIERYEQEEAEKKERRPAIGPAGDGASLSCGGLVSAGAYLGYSRISEAAKNRQSSGRISFAEPTLTPDAGARPDLCLRLYPSGPSPP